MSPRSHVSKVSQTSPAGGSITSTTSSNMPLLRIGPAGWAYKDWVGYVYPQPRPKNFHPATFLAEYFDVIEINASFYHPMQADHAAQWIERVSGTHDFYSPPNFGKNLRMSMTQRWRMSAKRGRGWTFCRRLKSSERCCCNSLFRFIVSLKLLNIFQGC